MKNISQNAELLTQSSCTIQTVFPHANANQLLTLATVLTCILSQQLHWTGQGPTTQVKTIVFNKY